MERRDDRHARGPREEHARPLQVAVDDVEVVLAVEHREHRRQEVPDRVVLEVRGTKGDRDGRDEAARNFRVARRERRHVVAAPDELDDELVHDPLRAAVALGRDALERWGDLGNAKRAIHRQCPPDSSSLGRSAWPHRREPRPALGWRVGRLPPDGHGTRSLLQSSASGGTPRTRRSSAPSGSSPSSGIRTSTARPAPTSASRRSTRPTRSCPTRSGARRYDMFGHAGDGGDQGFGAAGGFGDFGDIFDAFFGGDAGRDATRPPARRRRPPLRPPDHVRGGRPRRREGDRVHRARPLRDLRGQRRRAGHRGRDLPAVRRPRRDPDDAPDDARPDGQRLDVPALPRRGQDRSTDPCPTCQGDGRTQRKRTLRVTIPAGIDEGHQIRLSNEGEAGASRRAARQPLRRGPRRSRTRSSRREGTELVLRRRRLDRPGRARDADHGPDRRRRRRRSRSRPGPSPGRRSGCAASGVPHLRRAGSRGDLHVFVNVVVPTKLSKRQRELLAEYAEEAGEPVAADGGILRPGPRRAWLTGATAGAGGRGDRRRAPAAPGSSSRSRPTSRPSRRSARSWAGWRRSGRAWSRRSSWSTRGLARASTRRGRRSSGRISGAATRPRRRGRSPRRARRSATCRRSGCARSAS